MKLPFSFRWFLRPEGLITLMTVFWLVVYGINSSLGYDYFGIWPEPTLLWPLVLFVFAAMYYFTRGFRQWSGLQYFHVASLVIFPVLMFHWAASVGDMPEESYVFPDLASRHRWEAYQAMVDVLILPAAIFVFIGQVAFIVNIIAGFIRGKKTLA
ncbi:hypothetical protein ACQKLP_00605 [Chitinophaga sp. NPDC101104]|uniref:hypothetical protein n=1 Tax=Chitinophaga sp. NPDC101104 TaxID=3390561 RepID=UPI003D093F0D